MTKAQVFLIFLERMKKREQLKQKVGGAARAVGRAVTSIPRHTVGRDLAAYKDAVLR